MAYRLGVDVGGTFTDLFLVGDGNGDGGGSFRVKTPSTPADPSEGVLTGVRRICEEAGIDVGDMRNILHGTTVATNAVLESKGARVGLITTAGLPADPAPGALADAGAARGLDHHDQARSAGVARGHARGGRADGRAREHDRRRSTSSRSRASIRDLVESGVETLTIALINSYVNGAHERKIARDRRAPLPGLPGHALPRGAARVPRVRAGADRLHELVRAPEGRDVRRTACRSSCSGIGATADVNILRSDAGLMTTREAARNPIYGVLSGPVRRRRRRAVRRAQGRVRRHPHVRHGRDVDRRRPVPERPADDRPRDRDRPLPDQGAVGERAHGRRRRRLDRARPGADEGAARRPAVGRRRARARPRTARAATSRP